MVCGGSYSHFTEGKFEAQRKEVTYPKREKEDQGIVSEAKRVSLSRCLPSTFAPLPQGPLRDHSMDTVSLGSAFLPVTSLYLSRFRTVSFSGCCGRGARLGGNGCKGRGPRMGGSVIPGTSTTPFSQHPGEQAAHAYRGPSSPVSAAHQTECSCPPARKAQELGSWVWDNLLTHVLFSSVLF